MLLIWLGVVLVVAGLVYMAGFAIWSGRMSAEPSPSRGETLEPPRRGMKFFGLGRNLPGLIAMAVGFLLILIGAAM